MAWLTIFFIWGVIIFTDKVFGNDNNTNFTQFLILVSVSLAVKIFIKKIIPERRSIDETIEKRHAHIRHVQLYNRPVRTVDEEDSERIELGMVHLGRKNMNPET